MSGIGSNYVQKGPDGLKLVTDLIQSVFLVEIAKSNWNYLKLLKLVLCWDQEKYLKSQKNTYNPQKILFFYLFIFIYSLFIVDWQLYIFIMNIIYYIYIYIYYEYYIIYIYR